MIYIQQDHIISCNLRNKLQWNWIKLLNDTLQAVGSRGGAILVLLDLNAAFDTIDHEKLTKTLDTYCGIKGDPLKCFYHMLKAAFILYK